MIKMHKTRRAELIIYGYGTRTVFDLKDVELATGIAGSEHFTMNGEIEKTVWFGRKFFKKYKKWRRKHD